LQPVYHLIKARTVNKCGTDKGKAKKSYLIIQFQSYFQLEEVPFVKEKLGPIFVSKIVVKTLFPSKIAL
jgi:hypothetical protein